MELTYLVEVYRLIIVPSGQNGKIFLVPSVSSAYFISTYAKRPVSALSSVSRILTVSTGLFSDHARMFFRSNVLLVAHPYKLLASICSYFVFSSLLPNLTRVTIDKLPLIFSPNDRYKPRS